MARRLLFTYRPRAGRLHQDEWLEVLGCGAFTRTVTKVPLAEKGAGPWFGVGAAGHGPLAIPDIRLFWTDDERFHAVKAGQVSNAQALPGDSPASRTLRSCPESTSRTINELARSIGGELIEGRNIDTFTNPKTGKLEPPSITYRSMDRSLTDVEINALSVTSPATRPPLLFRQRARPHRCWLFKRANTATLAPSSRASPFYAAPHPQSSPSDRERAAAAPFLAIFSGRSLPRARSRRRARRAPP